MSVRPRVAVVLGRRARADGAAIVRDAAREGVDLLLVSVGTPPTERQRRIVTAATEAAFDSGVRVDAVLAVGRPSLLLAVGDAQVRIVADGGEHRWLVRTLGRRP